jgi:hypothetical protein
VDADDIDAAVGAHIPTDAVVYAPAGAGAHPDHQDVARYGAGLAGRVHEVRLYADSPYYLRYGLPSWATRTVNDTADEAVIAAFEYLGVNPTGLTRRHVILSDHAIAQKTAAMRAYRTEFEPVDFDFDGIASDASLMRHETYWTLL